MLEQFLKPMDHYSIELQELLHRTLTAWQKERREGEEMHITSSTIVIENEEDIQVVDMNDFLEQDLKLKELTTLERCLEDLEKTKDAPQLIFPSYMEENELERMHYLVTFVGEATFRNKDIYERLEAYYYLGEVLASRGNTRVDQSFLRKSLPRRRDMEVRKLAKRTYALFAARGLEYLYAVTYIRPSHISAITEADFYEQLVPKAKELRQKELLEGRFAGAHT